MTLRNGNCANAAARVTRSLVLFARHERAWRGAKRWGLDGERWGGVRWYELSTLPRYQFVRPDSELPMKRRSLLASLCALPLASCQGESATVRFKVIASALVDGRPIESSSVMEISYSKVTHSLLGTGGATRLYGEALIFDLGGKGTVYVLPIQHPDNAISTQVYEYGILTSFGITNGIGSLSEADLTTLRNARGRHPFKLYKTTRLPAFVTFANESDPKSVYEIRPSELGQHFPGTKFTGLDMEITEDPITSKLKDRLPWLKAARDPKIFPRDPPTARRPYSQLPLSYMLTPADFFGDASR